MLKVHLLALAAASFVFTAHASPFADAVVSYDPGVGFAPHFTNPEAALGEPSRINPYGDATDPFDPPYGTNQIVSIGAGGSLVVQCDTPILNHPNNLYGYDFSIFGNAGFIITNDFDPVTYNWIGTPATDGSLFGQNTGAARVSVSRDGVNFYLLNPALAPAVDSFPPTDGSGDFHLPLAPTVTQADFAGATLEDIRARYNGSGGGAAYDISWAEDANGNSVFLPEINFIRIDVLSGKAEIDAVAAVARQPRHITEDFATNPVQRGWRSFGDASLFSWDARNQNLAVTWDSSHTNSFFFRPLGTVLAKDDDFSFSFDVRLSDIRVGSTPGKSNEFEIAVGLLNYRSATNAKAFRGAGVSPTYGARNIVEFDYFPDAGFGDTFATTMISSNNVFAYAHNFPVTLGIGETFRLTLSYSASNQVLRTGALRNGAPFSPLADISLAGKPDFRVDSFAVISYSDAVQAGAPQYYGSVLAHGVLDNIELVVPSPPLGKINLRQTNATWRVEFSSLTNWVYTLEGSTNFSAWLPIGPAIRGNGATLSLPDTNASPTKLFYRVRAERP